MTNSSVDLKQMGKRIRDIRKGQKKTQEYFADLLFISSSYLALIESGKRTPTIDVLAQIAKVSDTSVDYLLFGTPSDNQSESQQVFQRLIETYPEQDVGRSLRLAEYYLQMEKTKKENSG